MESLPMQLLVKKLCLPLFQTHQSQSEEISFKLFIQKTTQVGTLPLVTYQPEVMTKRMISVFHLNINFLQYHFDELQTFLPNYSIDFQILGISESRLKTNISITTNIQLREFNIEHMPTNGGALLYIKDNINYKLRPDPNVEKEKELQSIFIKILQKTSKNII